MPFSLGTFNNQASAIVILSGQAIHVKVPRRGGRANIRRCADAYGQEAGQGLGFDSPSCLKDNVILRQFYCPLQEPSRSIQPLKDILEGLVGEDGHLMHLEVRPQLSAGHH